MVHGTHLLFAGQHARLAEADVERGAMQRSVLMLHDDDVDGARECRSVQIAVRRVESGDHADQEVRSRRLGSDFRGRRRHFPLRLDSNLEFVLH